MNVLRLCIAHVVIGCSLTATAAASAQPSDKPPSPPTESEVREQMLRLDQKNPEADRAKAAEWFAERKGAKNTHLAIAALTNSIRTDSSAQVREPAVRALGWITLRRKEPCPLAIIEAILDKNEFVAQTASAMADQLKIYAPGTIDILIRGADSEDEDYPRSVYFLGRAAEKNPKALERLQKATRDKDYFVRHTAQVALFHATNNLYDYVAHWLRVRGDPDEVVLGSLDKDSAKGKLIMVRRNLLLLTMPETVCRWSNERPDDLGKAILKLLESPEPELRRGAAFLVRVAAVKMELPKNIATFYEIGSKDWEKLFEPWSVTYNKNWQKSPVADYLDKQNIRDRLRRIRDDDTDSTVREAARIALERLNALNGKTKMAPDSGKAPTP